MELEIHNELLIESNNFYIKICPIETELNYLPSFGAKIDCKISPTIKLQYNYTDRIWFKLEDFDKFITDVQGIVSGTREIAELNSMSQSAIFMISKSGNYSKVTLNFDAGFSFAGDGRRIQVTTSFLEKYDFINILSRSITEFWKNFKCLLREENPSKTI
ncbi:hypothetical protein [Coleofasciculus sp. FACHB-1120]|uniref:hypothetical protein n=1 Tax=Coleofasciculus sp. FACHB-1120 TaxID=2692783 RepID=UPI001682F8A3|nr:hypothetical protein [Coleofasciculus sp. FACHB-1120]MBD2744903.1 hypothetical protein [Coleofasciculus sp. FACHB-1120]